MVEFSIWEREELFIDFMEGECRELIDRLHDKGCSMDVIYRDFCGAVFRGLEKRSRKLHKRGNRKLCKRKAWFGRELWRMRKEFHKAERAWLKGKMERRGYIKVRNRYRDEARRAQRNFEKKVCDGLDRCLKTNQHCWWKHVKKLMKGPFFDYCDIVWSNCTQEESVVCNSVEFWMYTVNGWAPHAE